MRSLLLSSEQAISCATARFSGMWPGLVWLKAGSVETSTVLFALGDLWSRSRVHSPQAFLMSSTSLATAACLALAQPQDGLALIPQEEFHTVQDRLANQQGS